jgi:2-polyprenyl-3-methyl-5-hydroxy-6-metoxy-1,4-benzoquinol methylase
MAEYVLNLVPKGTHTWDKFVKPSEIRDILEKSKNIFYIFILLHLIYLIVSHFILLR